MKRLLLILILTLSFQTLSKADDIRDFEIEGMSIGDSLLDYFNKAKIKSNEKNYYKKKDYTPVWIVSSKFKTYSGVQFHYKKSEKNYLIHALSGIKYFKNDIKNCHKQLKIIDNEFKVIFKNANRSDKGIRKHLEDKSGKSKTWGIYYFLTSGDVAVVSCYDWSKKMGYNDQLRISLVKGAFDDWAGTAF
tara:strand:- start:1040 stop:1609 length:570 start_codon:yes stop_codon:yes gene_type:complete